MQSLINDLESDLNGSFQTLAVMLTHGMAKFLSIELHETMSRSGTDEPSLTEIVMSRTNQELAEVRNFFLDCECIYIGLNIEWFNWFIDERTAIDFMSKLFRLDFRLWTYAHFRDRERYVLRLPKADYSNGRGT